MSRTTLYTLVTTIPSSGNSARFSSVLFRPIYRALSLCLRYSLMPWSQKCSAVCTLSVCIFTLVYTLRSPCPGRSRPCKVLWPTLGAGELIRIGEGCARRSLAVCSLRVWPLCGLGTTKNPVAVHVPDWGRDPRIMGDSVRQCVWKRSKGKRWGNWRGMVMDLAWRVMNLGTELCRDVPDSNPLVIRPGLANDTEPGWHQTGQTIIKTCLPAQRE